MPIGLRSLLASGNITGNSSEPSAPMRSSGLANGSAGYSRRQLLANAAIAASRVGS